MKDKKITATYCFVSAIAVLLTWILHEFTHWTTSELLGYDTILRLNGTTPISGSYNSMQHYMLVSAAGPITTIVQGFIVFAILMYKGWNKHIYLFLFVAFLMRLLAGIMNFINLNDEGRISEYLGLGTFTIPILVSALLFSLVYMVSKKYSLLPKFHLFTTLIVWIFISALILIDQFFKLRLL